MKVSVLRCLSALWMASVAAGASAQEVAIGLGAADYPDAGTDGAILSLDYIHTPFFQRSLFSLSIAANLSSTSESDIYIGAGIAARWQWPSRWFVETSVMPGAHFENEPGNDIGTTFNFRSLIGVGYSFRSGNSLSLALTHKSNASIDDVNPGADAVLLRYHSTF